MECNALPMLILMLRSEDTGVHYEAVSSHHKILIGTFALIILGILFLYFALSSVLADCFGVYQIGVIGNLVHSSPNIKKDVLFAGALQPVIELLRYC